MLVSGGIDLSVGATYSLAGVVAAHYALETNVVVAMLLGIGAGVLVWGGQRIRRHRAASIP